MRILSTFKLSSENIEKIKQLGAEVTVLSSEKDLIEYEGLENADAIIANHRTLQTDFLERCTNVKWIHCPHIGIERLPLQYLKERKIIVTNGRGAAGVPISEHIIFLMLTISRKGKDIIKNQLEHQWKAPKGLFNFYDKTVGFLGTGDVATEAAKRLKPFGMKILGMNTSGQALEHYDKVYLTKDINELLSQCDFIVCTLPPTDKTVNLIDEEQFKAMKSTAFIINISRAVIFNEKILYDYLLNKKIAGAALDVFMDEFKLGYLPEESPFWNLDNIIVTPHMAGGGDLWNYFSTKTVMHNLESFSQNRIDDMENIRDYDKGY